MSKFTEVMVVGCGPAGLLAAWAAETHGVPVACLTDVVQPSYISGAQYLHRPIPGLTDGMIPFRLKYRRLGDEQTYREKIYGCRDVRTSWDKFPDSVLAWDLQQVYDKLWQHYHRKVTHLKVDDLFKLREIVHEECLIISTAPRPRMLPEGSYYTETVHILNGECLTNVGHNEIVYYGDETLAYRSSNINGNRSIEYPDSAEDELPEGSSVKKISKPLSGAGNVPPGVLLAGRYGKWEKGVLVDDAFYDTRRFIKETINGQQMFKL